MTKTKTTVPNRSHTADTGTAVPAFDFNTIDNLHHAPAHTHTINEEKTILALLFVDWMYCWKTAAKKDCCFSHHLFDIFKHIFNKCEEKHVFVVVVAVVSTHTHIHSPLATPPVPCERSLLWREAAGKNSNLLITRLILRSGIMRQRSAVVPGWLQCTTASIELAYLAKLMNGLTAYIIIYYYLIPKIPGGSTKCPPTDW